MYKRMFLVSKLRFFCIIFETVISVVNSVVDIYFLKYIIEGLGKGEQMPYFIAVIGVKLGALLVYQCSINIFNNYVYQKTDQKIKYALSMSLFHVVKQIRLEEMETPEFYDKYQRAISQVDGNVSRMLNYLGQVLETLLTLVSLFLILFTADPVLIVIAAIGMAVTMWANVANTKNGYEADKAFTWVDRRIAYITRIFYQPQYARDIKCTGLARKLNELYKKKLEEREGLIRKHWPRIIATSIAGSWLFNVGNIGIAYLYLVAGVIRQVFSIGDLTALARTVNQLSNTLLYVSNIIPQGVSHSLYAGNYIELLHMPMPEEISSGETVCQFEEICLDNVSFNYPGNSAFRLENINLKIQKGQKIAIVGENGAGKTTLVNLILGLYQPVAGEISLNDIPYSQLPRETLHRLIGAVAQEYNQYAFPVKENIALLSEEFIEDEGKVWAALKQVGLKEYVETLDLKLEAEVSKEFDESGVAFSGGQSQRMAIARVIYTDPNVIIMDEPTSALDPLAEERMYQMIYKIAQGKTLILITHRLSCVKEMDNIIVLGQGKIEEVGTHDILMKSGGIYAEMFSVQSKRYSEER